MLRHKNIVELFHAFAEGKQFIMIMEYAGGGELLAYIEKNGPLGEIAARKIFLQIANAIHYCHGRGVVHRDLKLENILFKDDHQDIIKIIDFGIAGVCRKGQEDVVDSGTISFMPPECFGDEPVTSSPSLDVWAIGLMFYAMLYGTLPFLGKTDKQIKESIRAAKLVFPKDIAITSESKELLKSMLQVDPSQRLNLLNFMEMPYSKYDDEVFE